MNDRDRMHAERAVPFGAVEDDPSNKTCVVCRGVITHYDEEAQVVDRDTLMHIESGEIAEDFDLAAQGLAGMVHVECFDEERWVLA